MYRLFLYSFLAIFWVTMPATEKMMAHTGGNDNILTGKIELNDFLAKTEYKWFAENFNQYQPQSDAIEKLRKSLSGYSFIIVGGTWCSDTHLLLPQVLKVLLLSKVGNQAIDLYFTDRDKKTPPSLESRLQLTQIPMIVVYRNGAECGRIVEKSDIPFEVYLSNLVAKD